MSENDQRTKALQALELTTKLQQALHSLLAELDTPVEIEPMTVEQVAAKLKLSPDHTRALLADGKIKGHKTGRRWLVLPADLQAYLRGSTNR